jgi:hypothetical protein
MRFDAGHGWEFEAERVVKDIAGVRVSVDLEPSEFGEFHWTVCRIEGGAATFDGHGTGRSLLAAKADAERIGLLIAVNREAL